MKGTAMPKPPPPDVALRSLIAEDAAAILRATLAAGDYGILLTDLQHQSLACNPQFGRIFNVDPVQVVKFGVEELRSKVLPLIPNPAEWLARLEEIYSDPQREAEDDIELLTSPSTFVHRYTGPVRNAAGEIIGRLWTFRDVTRQKKAERLQLLLHELSAFHNPDPSVVCRRVLQAISNAYQTTAILSIRHEDYLEFREVAGPPSVVASMKGNKLSRSYCQFALQSQNPLLVQDARKDAQYVLLPPRWVGYTRYLGAPVYNNEGKAAGTLCLIDKKSDELLDDEDLRFISLMAMRVSAELAREEFIAGRIRDRDEALEREHRDLEETRAVLAAMNRSLRLLDESDWTSLVKRLLEVQVGVLGYQTAGLLWQVGGNPPQLWLSENLSTPKRMLTADLKASFVGPSAPSPESHAQGSHWAKVLKSPHAISALRRIDEEAVAVLLLGRDEASPLDDVRHRTLLDALLEQVQLVLAAHRLQSRMRAMTEELRGTRRQLIESEKLSAVGTLAAATAHDIRNILASLKFSLDESASDPRGALLSAREQIDRFSVLAHRLLSYTKPRLIERREVDLTHSIRAVIALIAAHAKISKVQINFQSIGKPPWVLGESYQLENLFVNLFLNAIQAMEPKGGNLAIQTRTKSDGIEVRVTDSGRGIPPDQLEEIYQPFSTNRSEGFGLGMYSCRRIVEEHQGNIRVESTVGRGTSFTVWLPAAPVGGGERPLDAKAASRR